MTLNFCYTTVNKFIKLKKIFDQNEKQKNKMPQFFVDCLDEIFEYLEYDKVTLFSCLLVNSLWCEAAVRILWRNSSSYKASTYITLINCLPNESKEILHNNRI